MTIIRTRRPQFGFQMVTRFGLVRKQGGFFKLVVGISKLDAVSK